MPKKLRLEERLRETGAVHRYVRSVAAIRMGVRFPGKNIFADAAFTRDKNLRVGLTRAPG
jgi:hypothetical protein